MCPNKKRMAQVEECMEGLFTKVVFAKVWAQERQKAEGVETVGLFHMGQCAEQKAEWIRMENGSAGQWKV